MKKLTFALISLVLILPATFVWADIIAPNTHPVGGKVALVNLAKFSDYAFIGYTTRPLTGGVKPYLIKEGEALGAGYKFNQLDIYAVKKDKLGNKVVDQIDAAWLTDNQAAKTKTGLVVYMGYLPDSDPINYKEIYYAVDSIMGNELVISKYKQITRYNNGQPEKVEYFQNNQPVEKPIIIPTNDQPKEKPVINPTNDQPVPTPKAPAQLNFFQKIGCFFKSLFGKNCNYR